MMTTAEIEVLEHQNRMRAYRAEFEKLWPEIEREAVNLDPRLAGRNKSFLMHLTWKAFLAGKGHP